MEKRYNFRIYPTQEQVASIQNSFGCCRFVYNYYLARRIEAYENGGGILGQNECSRNLTRLKKVPGYEWLAQVDDNALRGAI